MARLSGAQIAFWLPGDKKLLLAASSLDEASAKALQDADPDNRGPIPVELVTASASGLDPDVSPAAVEYQAARVARARHLELARVEALIKAHVQERLFGIVGERRINVLELNLALDRLR